MQRWTSALPRPGTAPSIANPRRHAARLDVSTSAWRQTRTTFSSPSCSPLSSQLATRWYIKQGSLKGQEQRSNSHDPARDPALGDYVEAKVDSVRVNKGNGTSVVYLRVQDDKQHCLCVYIGDPESQALLREIQKEHKARPLTHDVTKDLIAIIGYRVTKVRIHEIVNDTYYARIHVAPLGADAAGEQDVDARPSDAINLAVRFKAPIFIRRKIAALAVPFPPPTAAVSETPAEISASVREILAEFEDPTVMDTLHKEMAVQEQRFKDAHVFQQRITHEMTHNRLLRLVVAMECALGDLRFDEAARLRDEYRHLSALQSRQTAGANANGTGVE